MISLRTSTRSELTIFDEMDRQDHAVKFITQIGLKKHNQFFDDPSITYLSIENHSGELSGYIVLVLEGDNESLELRRILIDQTKRGVGQAAIRETEKYGREKFGVNRIWLDAFEDNAVGRHIYEKSGYRQFDVGLTEGRKLIFYEKEI